MKEKQEIKISLSTFFLILAILVIVVMAFIMYKIYNDKEIAISKDNDTENYSVNNESINENTVENLAIDSALVKKLYGYILKSDNFNYSFAWQSNLEPTSFYRDTKITYSSLSDMEKMLIVLMNYDSNEIKQVSKWNLEKIIDITHIHDTVSAYENIDEKSKEIFDQSNNNWKSYTGCGAYLTYKNDCYYLCEFDGGGKGSSEWGYSEIQKAEKNQEYIYIYDKFMYVDSNNLDIGEGDSKIHIYTSVEKTEDIGTETEWPLIYDEKINESSIDCSELYSRYESKLKKYKHTFKQNSDGAYYWYSTEPTE